MDLLHATLLGAIGGILPDVIKVIRLRHQKQPAYLGRPFFWISLLLLAGLGGAVAAWRAPADPVEALAYGAAAMTFITQMLALPDDKHLGEADRGFIQRIRRWWGA